MKKTDYDEKNKNYILDNLGQHFVFNALNTIKGAVITGSENTCSMINDLSDYMQYRLNTLRDDNRTVSLMEEIRHLKAYTRLEMARFSYIDIDIKEVPEKIKELSNTGNVTYVYCGEFNKTRSSSTKKIWEKKRSKSNGRGCGLWCRDLH